MKQILFTLFLASALNCNAQAQNDNLKINQLQVIGSHNSYRQAIETDLYNTLQAKDTTRSLKGLQYTHISITEQLNKGLRNLEIDVQGDTKGGKYAHPKGLDIAKSETAYDPKGEMKKPGFKVFHMIDIDFRTSCYTLQNCLAELKKWSDANPDHVPVFITLEPKDDDSFLGTKAEKFTPELFDALDKELRKGLGNKLITPDMVRGKYKTLEEAVLNNNWPTLKEAKGKFLFILDNNGAKRDLYALNHPSLKGRAVFINAEPGKPEAATLFRNNPEDHAIADLVKKGYIIRTRADADTKEARANDYSHFNAAKNSGAQIITTDYYLPSTFFNSPYQIKYDDGTYVRLDPVNN
ncbi:phosphatidylinositol-specific phospholipase C1-like protein [Flavobacterium sp. JLP]|uniref:phosphatidylinositol-specific phospholipase C1-like protein n=1 Tax=unclassified Flavobacterium TaxID=196869 RepID=UPI00188B9A27|nr:MULTISPECIES: phosphatidylinositol-specific phospholipase C1-like protein [unclassified Flavobacterium]MBF4494135.1 phosphatidylinositol-specific phospholipase C1-like protein [Flavobacterium sp. MR2016-29]MBF4507769.1 phosphatidylinositol-specific phospholipase C1-like protein [Flavobacterium sp. JLP]